MSIKVRAVSAAICVAAALSLLDAPGAVAAKPGGGLPGVVESQASLTISGNGYWHREMYRSGDAPVISPYDGSGQPLPDGKYRYEFREMAQSSNRGRRQLELLGSDDGGAGANSAAKAQGAEVISGGFRVEGGSLTFH